MIWPVIFAVLAPFCWASTYVFDKYLLVHRIRKPVSFAVIIGLVHLIAGTVIALFLDWSNVIPKDLLFPILAGILLGLQIYLYVNVLKTEDASEVVGLEYTYPILIAVLSFIFLKEVIPPMGYLGMAIIIAGVILLSLRFRKVKFESRVWMIVSLILLIALTEFFVKVATTEISAWQGITLNSITLGITLMFALLNSGVRKGFATELRNLPWIAASEVFTFSAAASLYFAMAGLPATIVSSIGATEPLMVLILERTVQRLTGNLTKDHKTLPVLVAIVFIVAGVVLMYASGAIQ